MLNFCDFIQVFVFTKNHYLNAYLIYMFQNQVNNGMRTLQRVWKVSSD